MSSIDLWERRACPTGGNNSKLDRPEISAKFPAENSTWEMVRDNFIGIRRDQIFFSYYRCGHCSLLYCPFYFSETQLNILYSKMPDNTMGESRGTAKKTQKGYAREICSHEFGSHSFSQSIQDSIQRLFERFALQHKRFWFYG